MSEKQHMTLPNGQKLFEGDYGVTRGGDVVGPIARTSHAIDGAYAFKAPDYDRSAYVAEFYADGRLFNTGSDNGDIIAKHYPAATPEVGTLFHGHARLPSGEVVDLTAIEKPFGLLPGDVQAALRAHGGPWEVWTSTGWSTSGPPHQSGYMTYRVKPQPPVPKVEEVKVLGHAVGSFGNWTFGSADGADTHRITFNLIDGEPDVSSVRMVKL